MGCCDKTEPTLSELAPPRRNHFFYGKRMDVQHFQMEQDYPKLKQWLMNRLAVGKGVLCGLDVTIDDNVLCVAAGVALDGLGREIIVPTKTCLDPFKAKDHACCGHHDDVGDHRGEERPSAEASARDRDDRKVMTLWLCYRECLTDYSPTLVADCEVRERCAPGTTIETYYLKLTEGMSPPLGDPEWCAKLWAKQPPDTTPPPTRDDTPPAGTHRRVPPETPRAVAIDRAELDRKTSRRELLCRLLDNDCEVDGDPCVPLAVVLLEGQRATRVEMCLVRPRVYSNAVLLDLILCLAARIDECCDQHTPPEPEPPEPPEPPHDPPTRTRLRVKGIEFLNGPGESVLSVDTLNAAVIVPFDKRPNQIRVHFTDTVDIASVTSGAAGANPDTFSFRVNSGAAAGGFVPGTITQDQPNVVRFTMDRVGRVQVFPRADYELRLFGDPNSAGRPAIAHPSGERLDAEPNPGGGFPSGNGTPGGTFRMKFVVQ